MAPPPPYCKTPGTFRRVPGAFLRRRAKKGPGLPGGGEAGAFAHALGGCCQTISGSSGRSDLRGSSLRRCSLAGDLRSSLRRCSLACSLGGSAVLLGHGRGGSSLRLSGSRSSLRGRSSSRRRAAAGSHADSQDQSSNGNTNILEFHIENLLAFEKIVSRKAVQVKPFRKKIF